MIKHLLTLTALVITSWCSALADQVYLIGDMSNWDRSDSSFSLTETSDGSNVFEGTYDIAEGQLCFKIMETLNCDWSELLCSSDENTYLSYAAFGSNGIYTNQYVLPSASNGEKAWQWPNWRGGKVKFSLDKNNQTLTLDYIDFFGLPEKLYVIGALQDWNIDNGDLALEPDNDNPYLYVGTLNISEGNFSLRFYKQLGDWSVGSMGATASSFKIEFEDGKYTGACKQGDINFGNGSWPGGVVTISVDLANYTVTFDAGTYSEPETSDTEIYLVGSPSGWATPSSANEAQYALWALPKVSDGVYEKTFDFNSPSLTGNLMFRFYKALTGWDGGDSYGIQVYDAPINCTFGENNVYDGPLVQGKGSYSFPSWTEGNMKITVNFNNNSVSMVKEVTNSIDSVISADGEKEYYRLDGTRMLSTPTKGFYILRQGGKAIKVIL